YENRDVCELRVAAQDVDELPTGHARHQEIQDDQTDARAQFRSQHLERADAVLRLEDEVMLGFEDVAHHRTQIFLVIHEDYAPSARPLLVRASALAAPSRAGFARSGFSAGPSRNMRATSVVMGCRAAP